MRWMRFMATSLSQPRKCEKQDFLAACYWS